MIGTGDFGNVRRIEVCLKVLRAIDRPTVLVAGNNESTDELAAACGDWPQAHVLHGSGIVIEGVPFFGIGGGIPVTPFGSWSYDFTEEQATELLADCPQGSVLVSHSPPHGAVDLSSRGQHLGSVAVREAVVRTGTLGGTWSVATFTLRVPGQQAMITGLPSPIVSAGPSSGMEWRNGCRMFWTDESILTASVEGSLVVMTLPDRMGESVIVGESLRDFLSLGIGRGYFCLEYLSDHPEKVLAAYTNPTWRSDDPDFDFEVDEGQRQLLDYLADRLDLHPWTSGDKLYELQKNYAALLQLPPEAERYKEGWRDWSAEF